MDETKRACIAIDLKSYYASVECVMRGLDPLDTNLVVADESRSTGTICLAVSPPLKAQGVPGRPRLFEVIQKVREINNMRKYRASGRKLVGESVSDSELKSNPTLALSYITAMPRMGLYIEYSMICSSAFTITPWASTASSAGIPSSRRHWKKKASRRPSWISARTLKALL